MKRPIAMFSLIVLILMSYPLEGQCYDVEFGGQVSSLYVLRDTSGFQDGFMDDLRGVQWRNTLEFEVTLRPEYEGMPSVYLDKVFLSYRGSYDAIFAVRRDAYDNVLEKSRDDFELGLDDVEWENDLREIFVDLVAEEGAQKVNLRLGRQIVRWGETDSFNVINVPNPSDYSYQMAFSDPDDLAIPLWMGRLDYTITGAGFLDTLGFEFLAIPDIRPTQQAPLSGKDGFANFDAPYAYTLSGYDGMGLTRIREDVASNTWENMEYAISLSFGIGALEASLHYFVGHQDNPAIDLEDYSLWLISGGFLGASELTFTHPRQRTYGYSFNYFVEWVNGVVRGEGALTDEMYLMETPAMSNGFDLTSIEPAKVYQTLLGFDKDLHPSWIGTRSALGCGVEAYWRHVSDWETDKALHPADKRDTGIFTALFYTDYYNGRIKPTVMVMYDTEGTWMTNMSLVYDMDGKWLFKLAQSSFWGNRNAISNFSYGGALINNSELSFKVSYRF